jgi:hypothetical protein
MILASYTPKSENLSLTLLLSTEVTKNVIAPRRQARKERFLLISPNLGAFAPLREIQFFRSLLHPKISNIFG